MIRRLNDVLTNQGENYILPFFWQHGETEEKLREYMGAIHNCGIGAVCVECRPHPDFCGDQWWHDMDIILDEAKKRSMKVWILDDAHFPTGQAAGKMQDAPDELCKQYLTQTTIEIPGPMPGTILDIASKIPYREGFAFRDPMAPPDTTKARKFTDDSLVAVLACDGAGDGIDGASVIDLTDKVENGNLIWDAPEGWWRLMVITKTRNGGGNKHYINVVSEESVRVQIDAVYEPHWEHYKDEFGKTIAGFFSDEPQLGNVGGFASDNWLGKLGMQLPWSDEVEEELKARWGADYTRLMATLWYPDKTGSTAAYARYHYMDVITRAVERDFSMQLGDWCAEHGVRYIGHTIEDNNQHARMGQSFGHQFRGLSGQHMGGIDDIGNQVLFSGGKVQRSGGFMSVGLAGDGEFYHHALGKFGSSAGILDPRKNGDSMCEIFGAYGWSEGTRLMKYLADHFMVRGINHYVPHAFSPKAFPDADCPPHFYAHGLNPLYKGFGELMRYMNRVCHLISGGEHKAPAAVLYHGEAEWTSREEGYMFTQKPLRALSEHQIDTDVLWIDTLVERERFGTKLEGKTLTVGKASFRVLVIPYSYYIPSTLANFLTEAAAADFPVIFVGGRPVAIADKPGMALPEAVMSFPVVSLDELPAAVAPYADAAIDGTFTELRVFHYAHENDLYMISNESLTETFSGKISLEGEGTPVLYDAMANVLRPANWDGKALSLTLEPYQSVIVAFGHEGETVSALQTTGEKLVLNGPWKVSFKHALEQAEGFKNEITLPELTNLAVTKPEFSGWVRYETTFTCASDDAVLELENAFEVASVTVNGKDAGLRFCPPYRYDLKGLVQEGENTLCIEVATTLERAVVAMPPRPDDLMAMMNPGLKIGYPYGLMGKVNLYTGK